MSKSELIRNYYNEGLTIREVADKVGVRYQFAYNVVSKMCEKKGEEVRRANKVTRASQFREMFDEGYSVGQIAKALNANYNQVHQTISKYKKQLKK